MLQQFFLDAHLIFFVFAFFLVVREDWKLVVHHHLDLDSLSKLSNTIIALLVGLWFTGIGLVFMTTGFMHLGAKMDCKLIVVGILTINAFILHLFAFPALSEKTDGGGRFAMIISFFGVVSGVSWVYAAFVGESRWIAPVMSFRLYMGIYIILLVVGLMIAAFTTHPFIKKHLMSRFNKTYMLRE